MRVFGPSSPQSVGAIVNGNVIQRGSGTHRVGRERGWKISNVELASRVSELLCLTKEAVPVSALCFLQSLEHW